MTCYRYLTIALIGIVSFQQGTLTSNSSLNMKKIIIFFLHIFIVNALMCWHCDSVQNNYCGEPFTGNKVTHNKSTYIECLPNKESGSISACVRAKVIRK